MGKKTPLLKEIPERLFSINEAAERIGVSRHTVSSAIRDGDLAAYRFGRSIRITEADLLAALKPVQSVEVEG